MSRSTQRRIDLSVLAIGALLLAGCSAPATVSSEEPSERGTDATFPPGTPSPSQSPTPSPTLPLDVSFDADAANFPNTWYLKWEDQFASAPQFTKVPLGIDADYRQFHDEMSQCDILLFAGPDRSGVDPSMGDGAMSDGLMVWFSGIGADVVAQYAFDMSIPQSTPGASVAARGLSGAPDDGSSSLIAARVIGNQEQAAFVMVSCPEADAKTEYEVLTAGGLMGLTASPTD